MGNKLDQAIKDALKDNVAAQRNDESKKVQAEHLWERLMQEVRQGVERINQDRASISMVGGKLEFHQVDNKGYFSDTMFHVKNETIPCLKIKVANRQEFLAVEVIHRFEAKGDVHEDELMAEELPFMIDRYGCFYMIASGQVVHDADALSVYLFEKFWKPLSRRQ